MNRVNKDITQPCQHCIENRLNCIRGTTNETCRRCVERGVQCLRSPVAGFHVADEMHGVQYGASSAVMSAENEDSVDLPVNFETHMFACPFYLRDPIRFKKEKTCSGPGYAEIHRLKEHLYRKHIRKLRCNRCYQEMESEAAFETHIRLPVEALCLAIDPPKTDTDGMTPEQVKQMKAKRRKQQNQTDIDSWKEMYRILFGPVSEAQMPPPYVEFKIPGSTRQVLVHEAEKYGEHIRSEAVSWFKTWIHRLIKENPDMFENDDLRKSFEEAEPSFKITTYESYRMHFEQRARPTVKTTENMRKNVVPSKDKDFNHQESPTSTSTGNAVAVADIQEPLTIHVSDDSNEASRNSFFVQDSTIQAALRRYPEFPLAPPGPQPSQLRPLKPMKSARRLQTQPVDPSLVAPTVNQYSSTQNAGQAMHTTNALSLSPSMSPSSNPFRSSKHSPPQVQANSFAGTLNYTVGYEAQVGWDQLGPQDKSFEFS